MEEYRGNFSVAFHHPDIIVSMDSAYKVGATWILQYFEDEIRRGTLFRAGETVQIGWMTVLLSSSEDGGLEVLEPEFGSVPIKWVRGANNTFRHVTIQKEVCSQISVEPQFPSMRQSGVISTEFFGSCSHFEMSRDMPKGNDSGWVFSEEGYGGTKGTLCSLYEVASAVPAVIPFLALPPGWAVRRDDSNIEITSDASRISSAENEFLKKLMKSSFFSN